MASTRRNGVRSAEIGREAESAVVRVLHEAGLTSAERRRVRRHDALDILVAPGVIASVKGGAHARTASLGDISSWWAEADRKRVEHRADLALLVVQRAGYGRDRAEHWRAWLIGADRDHWEAQLHTVTAHVVALGYGTPVPADPERSAS